MAHDVNRRINADDEALPRFTRAKCGRALSSTMILRFMSWAMARTPNVLVALDLPIELHAFLLELESCFLELLVLGL